VDVVDRNPERTVRTHRRLPWTLLIWPAALMGVVLVIWISGYLYWQIWISRAVADIKREPAKYFTTPNYRKEDLLKIGSRGFGRFFDELESALALGDEDQAAALHCGIADLVEGAWGRYGPEADRSRLPLRERSSWAEMRKDCREIVQTWSQYKDEYAPWGKWWKGHRGRRE
jgi:hypothetical protein